MRHEPPYEEIDKGIMRAVRVLWENGVETTESCEGGIGHSFPEPTVRFCGTIAAGYHAFSIALDYGLRPAELRRKWSVEGNELTGPEWEMTFTDSPALRDNPDDNKPMRVGKWNKEPGEKSE